MLTLGDVLTSPTRPGRDVHLFLPADRPWALSAPALVVDLDDGDEEPENVERRTGFRYVLPLSTVGQITANARRQLRTPTAGELLRAFLFYYNCDAFIDVTRGAG
ncbi:hypothetical protein GobsT_16240 [Gemmata obscuriglobus]|nr:hypothetical protein GobsT_16240 [Gemmata obscuriglobus]VTS02919.1 Uncharacterized protein OS=Burkholderia vietnamiensis (strain G4 / LMG 22486) GN=Bcep1808_0453 PE=4 SV=1 [Gemmata obscuriglobus UQM 2246]